MPGNASQIRAAKAYVEAGLDDSKLIVGLNRAAKKLKAWGDTVAATGYDLLKGGLATAAPLAFSAKSFADYEQALAELRAAANPTADEFDRVKESIDSISKATGTGQVDVAASFTELLKAGVDLKTVMGGAATAVIQFARVGGLEVGEAAGIMNDAMNVFKKDGLDAAQTVDVLSKAADASSISVQQVAQAFSQVGTVAAGAGQSMKDTAAVIALLGNYGVKGSDAGTSLKTMLTNLESPAAEGSALMRQLGISVRDAAGQILPMAGIVAELQAKLEGLAPQAKSDAFRTIFGTDAIRSGKIALREGAVGLADFVRKMDDSLTVAEKFAIVTDTLKERALSLWAAVGRVASAVGSALGPSLKSAAVLATATADAMADFASRNAALTAAVAAVSVAAVAGGGAMVALGLGLHFAGVAAGALATVLGSIAAFGSGVLSVVFSPVAIGAAAATAAVAGLGFVFLTTTDAGRQAAQGVRDAWGKVGGYVSGVLSTLRDDFGKTYKGINDAMASGQLGVAARLLWNGVQVEWTRGVAGLQDLWAGFTAKLTAATDPVLAWLGTSWEAMGRFAYAAFRSAVDGAVMAFSTIQALAGNWGDSAKLVAVSVGLAFVKAWELSKYFLTEVLPTSVGWFANNAVQLAGGLLLKLGGMIATFVADAVQLVKDVLPQVVAAVVAAVANGGKFADSVAQQIAATIAAAFARGYVQDAAKTGGPKFQDRQKSDMERSLEVEQAALSGALGDAIKKRFAENKAAVDAALAGIAAGGDGPSARDRLADLLKQRDALLRQATGRVGNGGAIGDAIDAMSKLAGVDLRKGLGSRGADVSAGATAGVAAAGGSLSSAGTFSSIAAAMLGGAGDFQARTAKATEKSNGLLKDVVRAIEKTTGVKFG